jgi:Leucine-rich repeat (LRR) protein
MNMRTILSLVLIALGMGVSAQVLDDVTSKPAQGLSKRTLRHVIARWTPFLVFVALFSSTANAQLLDAVALDSMRTFRSLEKALANPDQVYRLDLSGQKLKEVPEGVFQLKNLNALDLSNNKLKALPDRLQELRNMQDLRASRNKLTEVPKSLCRLTHLKRLDLSRNGLIGLPKCVGAFKELVSLDLWDNDLAEFPEEMSEMRALKFLDLRAIQFEVPEMEHLQELMPAAKIFFSQPCNCGM